MKSTSNFLAFDLGAESGRAILGSLTDGQITLREVSRFATGMMMVHDHYRWNIYRFYEEMIKAIRQTVDLSESPLSVGMDTWGVDFALFGEDGNMLDIPYCYRDSRTDGAMEDFFKLIPRDVVYRLTGIQFMQLNSLFQLFSMVRDHSPVLKQATDLLFIPDIFHYLLTGIKKTEFSYATTSQLYNPVKGAWEKELFDAMNLPVGLMQEIVSPGTRLGSIYSHICHKAGVNEIPMVAVATHDTGSAIAAIPAQGHNWAYISSGTWSLMGIESKKPIISDKSLRFNITNEGGVEHTFRVLKNIMGLWLIQQARAAWAADNYSYSALVEMGHAATPFRAVVDPDHRDFLNPVDMPAAIVNYCRTTNQPEPENRGEIIRVIFESLAMKYRFTLDQLREISEDPIEKLYIIGGGVQNELLCQFTANACGIPVITGPSEGTALGNILVQAMAMGCLGSLEEIREVVRKSFPSKFYEPVDRALWEEKYQQSKKYFS